MTIFSYKLVKHFKSYGEPNIVKCITSCVEYIVTHIYLRIDVFPVIYKRSESSSVNKPHDASLCAIKTASGS